MRCARTKTDSVAGDGDCAITAPVTPAAATHATIERVAIREQYTALHLIGVRRLLYAAARRGAPQSVSTSDAMICSSDESLDSLSA